MRAAAILSGAKIPGVGGFDFPAPSPPLLATQGTADTVNPPHFTRAFFDVAPAPKFLLAMFGAPTSAPTPMSNRSCGSSSASAPPSLTVT
ncbi:MAG: hypothetical protein WBP81_37910 [Solirubrobacteraceae bacterium]